MTPGRDGLFKWACPECSLGQASADEPQDKWAKLCPACHKKEEVNQLARAVRGLGTMIQLGLDCGKWRSSRPQVTPKSSHEGFYLQGLWEGTKEGIFQGAKFDVLVQLKRRAHPSLEDLLEPLEALFNPTQKGEPE